MATTSDNLTAGAATSGGRGGDGTGHKRRAAGLVATAALGLSLLTGMIVSETHQAAPPTSGNPAVTRPQVWGGACRPGGGVCLPDEDFAAPAQAVTRPQVWTGTCRAGSSDCLPDEDYAAQPQAPARAQVWGGACRPGGGVCIPDEDYAARPQAPAADTAKKYWELLGVSV